MLFELRWFGCFRGELLVLLGMPFCDCFDWIGLTLFCLGILWWVWIYCLGCLLCISSLLFEFGIWGWMVWGLVVILAFCRRIL